jgi:hypothetical protein
VILENTFDQLVEEVRSDQLVNICTRKMFCERLGESINTIYP